MKLLFAVVAEGANQTKSGSMNIHGMFTELITESLPATCPMLNVVFWFEAKDCELDTPVQLSIKISGSEGEVVSIQGELKVDSTGMSPVAPMSVPIPVVSFPAAGSYHVEVSCEETSVSCEFQVRQVP